MKVSKLISAIILFATVGISQARINTVLLGDLHTKIDCSGCSADLPVPYDDQDVVFQTNNGGFVFLPHIPPNAISDESSGPVYKLNYSSITGVVGDGACHEVESLCHIDSGCAWTFTFEFTFESNTNDPLPTTIVMPTSSGNIALSQVAGTLTQFPNGVSGWICTMRGYASATTDCGTSIEFDFSYGTPITSNGVELYWLTLDAFTLTCRSCTDTGS